MLPLKCHEQIEGSEVCQLLEAKPSWLSNPVFPKAVVTKVALKHDKVGSSLLEPGWKTRIKTREHQH